MSVLDAAMGPLASTLAGTFGKPVTYRVQTTTRNTVTREVTVTTTDYAVTALIETFGTSFQAIMLRAVDGDAVRNGDLKASIAADDLPVTPKAEDRLVVSGQVYTVVTVDAIYSGAEVALWTLQVRS